MIIESEDNCERRLEVPAVLATEKIALVRIQGGLFSSCPTSM